VNARGHSTFLLCPKLENLFILKPNLFNGLDMLNNIQTLHQIFCVKDVKRQAVFSHIHIRDPKYKKLP